MTGADFRTSRMTGCAGFDLREVAGCFQVIDQTIAVVLIPEKPSLIGNLHMQASGAMAGFTVDVDIRKRGRVFASECVEVFFQIGTMTNRTVRIPPLADPGPVQRIIRIKFFVYIWWR